MLTFEDYFDLLEERQKVQDYFNSEARAIAEYAKYNRNNRVTKKYQKDNEKAHLNGMRIYYTLFNKKMREKGAKVTAVKQTKESGISRFFKRLVGIKPKEIAGEIEFSTIQQEEKKTQVKPEIESEASEIEKLDDMEDLGGIEYTDEELDELYPNEQIKGQMDIEELNEGDVYEK